MICKSCSDAEDPDDSVGLAVAMCIKAKERAERGKALGNRSSFDRNLTIRNRAGPDGGRHVYFKW